jgi:uncharacterized membrane protein YgaE (UPF0421/DUF939 family)
LHIKRKSTLNDNVQKTCSLVTRQCTNLLQSKLKQQANSNNKQTQWSTISQEQDSVTLSSLVETVAFRFEDQKFPPLALCQSNANLCNLRQGNMTDHEHLQAECNDQFHNQAIVDVATKRKPELTCCAHC